MATIEDKIGYTFKNREYLMEALTHSSFANERHNKIKCNERMEFLGDAVLSIISADFLYHRFPDMPEGDLSKLRSSRSHFRILQGKFHLAIIFFWARVNQIPAELTDRRF
mgnify:CR=1 FL=1